MGTNYYAITAYDDLATADTVAEVEVVHLGKLSAGWAPTVPFDTEEQWVDAVRRSSFIRDEYGRTYTPDEAVGKFVWHSLRNPPSPTLGLDLVGPGEFS